MQIGENWARTADLLVGGRPLYLSSTVAIMEDDGEEERRTSGLTAGSTERSGETDTVWKWAISFLQSPRRGEPLTAVPSRLRCHPSWVFLPRSELQTGRGSLDAIPHPAFSVGTNGSLSAPDPFEIPGYTVTLSGLYLHSQPSQLLELSTSSGRGSNGYSELPTDQSSAPLTSSCSPRCPLLPGCQPHQ
ncbi:unnamed protein product [Pleuronectes platessa]|uniref:Uncharacterized protein n=1 Tax=Pleuronectes platessa TaxID=8262 RepID=A0A9N7YVY3_PLEPL|nr:unnamed protein product [Pleuronectes platessa]